MAERCNRLLSIESVDSLEKLELWQDIAVGGDECSP